MRLLDLVQLQLDGQLDAAVAAGRYDPAQAAVDKAVLARLVTDFRARRPLRYTGMSPNLADSLRTAIFAPVITRYVRSDDAVDPPRAATRIPRHTRILVTCGTADTQVPCSTTGPLVTALRRTDPTGPLLRVLPGLDHFLHPAGTPINDQILTPAAHQALRDFARPWACTSAGADSPRGSAVAPSEWRQGDSGFRDPLTGTGPEAPPR
jgi:uncharacterized protein